MPSTPPPHLDQNVDILEMNEAFEEVDGRFQFTSTLIVYRAGNDIHHAVSKVRYASASVVRLEHLTNDILIPVSAYSPPFSSEFTLAPDTLSCDIYVKNPRLIPYDRTRQEFEPPTYIADSLLREIEVCEMLKRHPHPNIAAYLGCQVSDGRVTGICVAKYDCTLKQKANPGSFL